MIVSTTKTFVRLESLATQMRRCRLELFEALNTLDEIADMALTGDEAAMMRKARGGLLEMDSHLQREREFFLSLAHVVRER